MTQFRKFLSLTGVALSLTITGVAQAEPTNLSIDAQLNRYNQDNSFTGLTQINSVFQLRDVAPSDWAFDALRNLVEKYNCIAGYPNGSFRGDRPLSRYEFAAGLNACLQQIERLITDGGADVDQADVIRLRSLVQEFDTELGTLGDRLDNLEGRVEFLEDNQFSATTKLKGEVVFALADSFGDTSTDDNFLLNNIRNGTDIDDSETTLSNRVRLTLETSFTGKDTLITRLTAGNSVNLAPADGGTNTGSEPGGGVGTFIHNLDTNNDIQIDWLAYYFPIADKVNTYIAAFGGLHSDYLSTTFGAKGLEDFTGANGALTYFTASSPIYLIGGGGGAGLNFPVGPLDISLGYLANEASNPASEAGGFNFGPDTNAGLFNGDYGALAQVALNLGDRAEIGFTYVNAFQTDSMFASGGNSPLVGSSSSSINVIGLPVIGFVPPITRVAGADTFSNSTSAKSNTFGLQGRFDITNHVSLALYGLYSDITSVGGGSGEIWSYAASLGVNDLGREGNVLGLSVGVPPYVGGRDGGGSETPLQIEGFYKYQLNNNISITPGVVWIDNASEGFYGEDSALLTTLRTTFSF